MLRIQPKIVGAMEVTELDGNKFFVAYYLGLTFQAFQGCKTVNVFDDSMEIDMFTWSKYIDDVEDLKLLQDTRYEETISFDS